MNRYLYCFMIGVLGMIQVHAQGFSYQLNGNPLNTAGWTYGGNGFVSGNQFTLTPAAGGQSGYIYYATPKSLTTCSQFTVSFQFQITNPSAYGPADGLAFWYISNPPSGFTGGGGMGLPGYPNGLALIFDVFDNDHNGDNPLVSLLNYNGTVSGYSEGTGIGRVVPDVPNQAFIADGNWHTCVLSYTLGRVSVAFDGAAPIMAGNTTLPAAGYFGFSAATGSEWATQAIRNVSINGPNTTKLYVNRLATGANDGSSWANAFTTLSQALDLANTCTSVDSIFVARGTYYPMISTTTIAASPDSAFRILRNGIKVFGGFAGNETAFPQRNVAANLTILSGDIGIPYNNSDNAYHVVTIVGNPANNIDTNTIVDGFTITGGNGSPAFTYQTLNGSTPVYRTDGAGILCGGATTGNASSPLIQNCSIISNNGQNGTGMFCSGNGGGVSSPVVRNCTFSSNQGRGIGAGLLAYASGGGARTNPVLQNCTFTNNTAGSSGGGLYYETLNTTDNCILTISSCTFTNNQSGGYGGAVFCSNAMAEQIRISNSVISGNTAAGFGGGIYCSSNQAEQIWIDGSVISNNSSGSSGAGFYAIQASGSGTILTMGNTIVYNNAITTAGANGAGFRLLGVGGQMNQCLIANNSNPFAGSGSGGIHMTGGALTLNNTTMNDNTSGNAASFGNSIYADNASSLTLNNSIVWSSVNTPQIINNGLATYNYTDIKGIAAAASNLNIDPMFVSPVGPTGPDGIWRTADDGLQLKPCSPVINAGNNGSIPSGMINDITGAPRIYGNIVVDIGAYEYQHSPYVIPRDTFTRSICSYDSLLFKGQYLRTAGYYSDTLILASGCDSITVLHLIVIPTVTPSVTVTSSTGNMICAGTNVTFTATPANGGTTPVYQWRKNGISVGTNAATYSDNGLVNGDVITVQLTSNATCRTVDTALSSNITMTVGNVPGQPGAITGNTRVCAGAAQTYSIGTVNGATSYTWTLPPGWTGASNTTTINATVGTASGPGTISVVASNGCGASVARTLADTVLNIPAQPGAVAGNTAVCSGSAQSYSIAAVPEAVTYTWTVPTGWAATSSTITGMNTTAATATGTGNITVTATNQCGTSVARTLGVSVSNIPATPAGITGNVNVCAGSTQVYGIAAVPEATSYTWSLPATGGWTGTSTTNTINAAAGTVSGAITVRASNFCGTSGVQSLNVTVTNIPMMPAVITGNTNVCAGTAQSYGTTAVAGATSYTWMIPGAGTGWTSSGATNTTMLSTTAGNQSGAISVTASNFCGTSPAQSLPVTVVTTPVLPGAISGNMNVCGGTAQTYSVATIPQATTYTWTIPGNGWTATGAIGNTVTNNTPNVATIAGTAGGTISVTAGNFCGTSAARTLNVTVTNIPGRPGVVSGPDSLCAGAGGTWSIGYVNEATGYTWTLPTSGGWTGSSTTQSITAGSGAVAPGGAAVITVSGTNFCGTGPSATKSVWITRPVVPTLSLTSTSPVLCSGQPVTFTATSTGGGANPTYQWRINGINTGTASPNPVFTSTSLNNGDVVSVVLASSALCATPQYLVSTGITVQVTPTVTPGVNINANRASNTLCAGTPVTFTATPIVGAGPVPSYQWLKNGMNVGTGATTYVDAALITGDSIGVIMTSSEACVTSATARSNTMSMYVWPVVTPSVTVSASPGVAVSAGTVVTFTATVTDGGANPGYQWLKNGRAIAGATSSTYTTNGLRNGDVITVQVRADQVCVSGGTTIVSGGVTMLISTGVGGNAVSLGSVRLYPNPNGGRFTVSVTGGMPNRQVKLEVLGVLGQVVSHTAVTPDKGDWSVDMDLGDAAAGVYLLRLSDALEGKRIQVQRFEVVK